MPGSNFCPASKTFAANVPRSEERFSRNAETDLVCRLLLEKNKPDKHQPPPLPPPPPPIPPTPTRSSRSSPSPPLLLPPPPPPPSFPTPPPGTQRARRPH